MSLWTQLIRTNIAQSNLLLITDATLDSPLFHDIDHYCGSDDVTELHRNQLFKHIISSVNVIGMYKNLVETLVNMRICCT